MSRPPNSFLQSLSHGDFELLRAHLRTVPLPLAKTLFDVGGRVECLYFPHSGAISFVVVLADGGMVEAAIVGYDSVAGTPAALDDAVSLNRAIVQCEGIASVIDMPHAQAAVAASRTLRKTFYLHDQILMAQAQQSAACNAKHEIDARLSRWLLRMRDVTQNDTLCLTQEFISIMLGVRRTSVTLAARQLQASKIIKYRRGQIQILDVSRLEESACECHEALKLQAARLLGPPQVRSAL